MVLDALSWLRVLLLLLVLGHLARLLSLRFHSGLSLWHLDWLSRDLLRDSWSKGSLDVLSDWVMVEGGLLIPDLWIVLYRELGLVVRVREVHMVILSIVQMMPLHVAQRLVARCRWGQVWLGGVGLDRSIRVSQESAGILVWNSSWNHSLLRNSGDRRGFWHNLLVLVRLLIDMGDTMGRAITSKE